MTVSIEGDVTNSGDISDVINQIFNQPSETFEQLQNSFLLTKPSLSTNLSTLECKYFHWKDVQRVRVKLENYQSS